MVIKPIKQSKIADEVYKQLKHSIASGDLQSGKKLPSERDLAEQFAVNRVAVHEALLKLEYSGFLTTRLGAGGWTFVTDLSFKHLTDTFMDLYLMGKISVSEVYQVRLIIEPEIAKMAASRITPADTERLKETIEAERDPELFHLFHFVVSEICGNSFLDDIQT